MSVYFVTCREANAVKIGFSVEPRARLPEIQWGCPLPLTLEAVMPGNHSEEARLHGWFADERITGEWFRLSETIELVIKNHSVPHVTGIKRDYRAVRKPRPRRWHRMSAEEKYAALMEQGGAKAMGRHFEPVAASGGQFNKHFCVRDRDRRLLCSDMGLTWDQADRLCDVLEDVRLRAVKTQGEAA